MADITIVNGIYKPTYNWGAPSCRFYCFTCVLLVRSLSVSTKKSWPAREPKELVSCGKCNSINSVWELWSWAAEPPWTPWLWNMIQGWYFHIEFSWLDLVGIFIVIIYNYTFQRCRSSSQKNRRLLSSARKGLEPQHSCQVPFGLDLFKCYSCGVSAWIPRSSWQWQVCGSHRMSISFIFFLVDWLNLPMPNNSFWSPSLNWARQNGGKTIESDVDLATPLCCKKLDRPCLPIDSLRSWNFHLV